VLAAGQVDYLRNQGTASTGMPGQFSTGYVRNNNWFPHLNDPLQRANGYSAAYVMGQQMVFRPDGPGTTRGATVWAAWSSNFKDVVSPIPLFWGAGVSYQGLIPSRKGDLLSGCLIRTEPSRYASSIQTEGVLEFNYQWNHSRFLTIMPHGQYFWQKEGVQKRNATVLGLQLAITL